MMIVKDLRQFIQILEEKGDLLRIKAEVDWNDEIGAIIEEALRRDQPALLFDNVKDYKETECNKLLVNTALGSFSRILTAFGLPDDMHPMEAIRIMKDRCRQRLKPILLSEGPCKEVKKFGEQVDLFELPVPKWHARDGGRYILTWGAAVTKDPETGWVNAGLYRGMIQAKNKMSIALIEKQHAWLHAMKYEAMGKKSMPIAISLGSPPVVPFVACATFPKGVHEYDVVGAIQQEPLELVKCETVDLEVPATSEIILEGEYLLDPATFMQEGPFGEYPGTYLRLKSIPRNIIEIKCITHRKNPILHGHMEGMGPHVPQSKSFPYLETISLWHSLEDIGVPGITGIYPGDSLGVSHPVTLVSIENMYYGHSRHVATALWSVHGKEHTSKIVIVCDSDVDITDKNAIFNAIAQRVRPMEDISIFPGTIGGALDPSVLPEIREMTGQVGRWDRVVIDATWPIEWQSRPEWDGGRHPVYCSASKELLEKVRKRWPELGFK
ncbi:UbiD family decarboxylase [Chloroflexota bacterium]